MRHRDLWVLVVEALESYKLSVALAGPLQPTPPPEDHIAEVIAEQISISSDESSFVRECFLGVLRYEHVCEGILLGFCEGLKRNKQDRYSMYLIAYLLVYRFAEVTGRFLRSLMDKCTSTTRIAEFVQFLLSESMMTEFATPILRQWYSDDYIDAVVIGNLQKHRLEAERDVLQYYQAKATNPQLHSTTSDDEASGDDAGVKRGAPALVAAIRSTKPLTRPKSPNFSPTVVRKRDAELKQVPPYDVREMLATIPPEKPPRIELPRDGVIPLDGVRPPKDPSTLARSDNPFIATERPMHRERLLEEKRVREEGVFLPDPVMQTRLLPEEVRDLFAKSASSAPTVKQTTASIRREELLYRKRDEAKELALLKKAQEMRDDTEYQAWRTQQEEAARIARETEIAERKLQMMLADEDAKASRARQEKRNAESAFQFRRMMSAWREAAAQEDAAERKRKLDFASNLRAEVAEQTELAVRQVLAEKKVIAEKAREESQANELKAATWLELERQRKAAMILEIRSVQAQSLALRPEAIEKAREARLLELGVLGTMSVDELHNKLKEVKAEHAALESSRRTENIQRRSGQRRELEQMAARCEFERQLYLDEKEREREARREQAAALAERQRVVEEARLIELQAKLQKKREERQALQDKRKEEERQRRVEAMLLAGDAGAMEVKKWGEMERGVKNRLLREQNTGIRQLRQDRARNQLLDVQRETNVVATAATSRSLRQASDTQSEMKRTQQAKDLKEEEDYRLAAITMMRQDKASMRTRTA